MLCYNQMEQFTIKMVGNMPRYPSYGLAVYRTRPVWLQLCCVLYHQWRLRHSKQPCTRGLPGAEGCDVTLLLGADLGFVLEAAVGLQSLIARLWDAPPEVTSSAPSRLPRLHAELSDNNCIIKQVAGLGSRVLICRKGPGLTAPCLLFPSRCH